VPTMSLSPSGMSRYGKHVKTEASPTISDSSYSQRSPKKKNDNTIKITENNSTDDLNRQSNTE